jgi:hypothetical protein
MTRPTAPRRRFGQFSTSRKFEGEPVWQSGAGGLKLPTQTADTPSGLFCVSR